MINGDSKNNIIKKILYFPQCLYNLKILSRSKKCINIIEVELVKIESATGSPSRILSNMFWETIDWVALAQQLGPPVKIFDIACGKGHYANKYRKLLGDNFGGYTGIDIYKNKQFPVNYTHILDRAEFSAKYIKEENLITSQSGLEHIEEDFITLLEITDKLVKNKKPFIQIHLVPASLSLFLYFWHGYRQYSINNWKIFVAN